MGTVGYHVLSRLRLVLVPWKDVVRNGSFSLFRLWLCNSFGPGTMLNFSSSERRLVFCARGSTPVVLY